jgi:hypothetical protein
MSILINFLKLVVYIIVVSIEYVLKFLLDIITYIKNGFNKH